MQAMYCWRKEWILPFESAWSVLEKFTLTHHTDRNSVLRTLGSPEVKQLKSTMSGNIHRNLITLNGFDNAQLKTALDYDLIHHNQVFLAAMNQKLTCSCRREEDWIKSELNWCESCMKFGYHSLLHQFRSIHFCPFHQTKLKTSCPKCNAKFYFLFSNESLDSPFTCKCGHELTITKNRWRDWVQSLKIHCEKTLKWLSYNANSDDESNKQWLFQDHLLQDENALHFLNCAINLDQNDKGEKYRRITSSPYLNKYKFEELKGIPGEISTKVDHMNSYTLFRGKKFTSYYEFICEQSRSVFKAIDHHLKKRILKPHKTCILRFQHLLKEPYEDFPLICPFAYAYVFWKQSLLQEPHFYKRFNGAYKKTNMDQFQNTGSLYHADLKRIYDQFLEHTFHLDVQKPGVFLWILMKTTGYMYLQLFRNWQDIAEEGASTKSLPNSKELKILYRQNMPLMAFRHPIDLSEKSPIEFHAWVDEKKLKPRTDLNCPYRTQKMRKISNEAFEHNPIALSMINTNIDHQLHVKEYIRKLTL